MVDIVGINSPSNQLNRITDRSAGKGSTPKTKGVSTSNATGDRVDISDGAKEAGAANRLISLAQAEPEIRADVVASAKEKLKNGDYDGVEVSRQTAKNILGIK